MRTTAWCGDRSRGRRRERGQSWEPPVTNLSPPGEYLVLLAQVAGGGSDYGPAVDVDLFFGCHRPLNIVFANKIVDVAVRFGGLLRRWRRRRGRRSWIRRGRAGPRNSRLQRFGPTACAPFGKEPINQCRYLVAVSSWRWCGG